MSWLTYADDEVKQFHPEFKLAADEALQISELHHDYEWFHHIRTPGSPLIPDFALGRKVGHQWAMTLEIKQKKEAVYSTRHQIQAKGYAEENLNLYRPNAPQFFAISNLEVTLLFALNGSRPPRECLLQNGVFESGEFNTDTKADHRERFIRNLVRILKIVTSVMPATFDSVWPGVLSSFLAHSENLPHTPDIGFPEPNTPNWRLVRDYFATTPSLDSSRLFILGCLMAEYLRGVLIRHSHPKANNVPPLEPNQALISIANAIDALRQIDFQAMFSDSDPDLYRRLNDDNVINLCWLVRCCNLKNDF